MSAFFVSFLSTIDIPPGVALPLWFIGLLMLINALKPYISIVSILTGKKTCEERISALEDELETQKKAYNNLITKYEEASKMGAEIDKKYTKLQGLITGFSVYLKQNNLMEFPDIESFLNGSND